MKPELSLYEQLLGDDFQRLPPVLREFHARQGTLRAKGEVAVLHGMGRLRGWAARLMKLPRAGERIALQLEITAAADRETWRRSFDGDLLETQQWKEQQHLVEHAGPISFLFQLKAADDSLTFEPLGCRVVGIRLPKFLSPHVFAQAAAKDRSWSIHVSIGLPILGVIATYQGEITPL